MTQNRDEVVEFVRVWEPCADDIRIADVTTGEREATCRSAIRSRWGAGAVPSRGSGW